MNEAKRKRRRGVVLTSEGLAKLQEAKSRVELEENLGKRYTLEELNHRTGLAIDTLMKIFRQDKVDKQSLHCCFQAFNLVLEDNSDYCHPEDIEESDPTPAPSNPEPEFPEGQVPLDSIFYVEQPEIESGYNAIVQPGALLRIKAPRRMGKTSLMARILHQAAELNYRTVSLSLQLAEICALQNLDKFLQWFCASVGLGLGLPNRVEDHWDDLFGSKISCKMYFESYLLTQTEQPLVLGLDDVDRLFQYPELADEFFGLLRTWHEEAKNRDIWKRLRLVVAHSTEVYIPLSVNKSPFNVGIPIELPPFTNKQVQDLAKRHGLDWSEQQVQQLMALVGGNAYLVRVALYHICRQEVTLEQLLHQSFDCAKAIYKEHLRQQSLYLKQYPELVKAFDKVITTSKSVELDLVQAFKLQSMGLVNLQGNQARPSCQLYTQYFRTESGRW
ncbi:MAG: serine/threonine protein kinase [Symploca sp. SIO1B1]|nr:serine/threonine protein kinase [Symploca sp. SIO2D2]NER47104.1 serine/threonine protein kinase [Symploca sp. SIO1A3]NER96869.1 serine/threonine protein kinase [Symploca sp. SIO1B1]